jgi:hypothetical protein
MAQSIMPASGANDLLGSSDAVRAEGIGPLLGANATLHHIGFVVASISNVAEEFAASISAQWNGQIFHDPGLFLRRG